MAKPFNGISGCSMHLHVSLWKDGEPAFAPDGHDENALHRAAIGGIMRHLPGIVMSDLVDHDGELIRTAPRTVLQRAVDRIAALGYTAEVGVELEFYLLDAEGGYLADGVQSYSLQKANEMDPAFGGLFEGLSAFCDVEAANVEYGPAQCEVNLRHASPMAAGDQAMRFKYAAKELARRPSTATRGGASSSPRCR